MKRIIILVVLVLVGCKKQPTPPQPPPMPEQVTALHPILRTQIAPSNPPVRKDVTLRIQYPTNELIWIDSFKFYSATNLALPFPEQWTVVTQVPAPQLTVTLPVIVEAQFFRATASNLWGESLPSNPATLPGAPRITNLTIE